MFQKWGNIHTLLTGVSEMGGYSHTTHWCFRNGGIFTHYSLVFQKWGDIHTLLTGVSEMGDIHTLLTGVSEMGVGGNVMFCSTHCCYPALCVRKSR